MYAHSTFCLLFSPANDSFWMEITKSNDETDDQTCDMGDDINARLQKCHNDTKDDDRQHDLAKLRQRLLRIIDESAECSENPENRSTCSGMLGLYSAKEIRCDICKDP